MVDTRLCVHNIPLESTTVQRIWLVLLIAMLNCEVCFSLSKSTLASYEEERWPFQLYWVLKSCQHASYNYIMSDPRDSTISKLSLVASYVQWTLTL